MAENIARAKRARRCRVVDHELAALGIDVDNEPRAMFEVALNFTGDIAIPIVGRPDLDGDIGRERRPLLFGLRKLQQTIDGEVGDVGHERRRPGR